MARLVGLSLGTIWRWVDRNNAAGLVDYARKLDIDGIELNFSRSMLLGMRLDAGQLAWMRKLPYVSVHAPFELQKRPGAAGAEDFAYQLDELWSLYKRIGAKNLVMHPSQLPGRRLLDEYDFHISTENMSGGVGCTTAALKKILHDYPNVGLCLDVSHAFAVSAGEAARLVEAFGSRITQVHFSCTAGSRTHQSLGRASRAFLESIAPVKRLDVPFIIEEDMRKEDMERLKAEVRLVRGVLSEPGAI